MSTKHANILLDEEFRHLRMHGAKKKAAATILAIRKKQTYIDYKELINDGHKTI